jgi:hypothetical protein
LRGSPLLRSVVERVERVERGEVAPNIDAVHALNKRSKRTAGCRPARQQASWSCCRARQPPKRQ